MRPHGRICWDKIMAQQSNKRWRHVNSQCAVQKRKVSKTSRESSAPVHGAVVSHRHHRRHHHNNDNNNNEPPRIDAETTPRLPPSTHAHDGHCPTRQPNRASNYYRWEARLWAPTRHAPRRAVVQTVAAGAWCRSLATGRRVPQVLLVATTPSGRPQRSAQTQPSRQRQRQGRSRRGHHEVWMGLGWWNRDRRGR